MIPRFEIGVVYRKGTKHCLAVDEDKLVTFRGREAVELRPQVAGAYEVVRSISVDALCTLWEITLEDLDQVTARYLAPAEDGLKTRPRGSRRRRAADELAWRNLRLTRLHQAG